MTDELGATRRHPTGREKGATSRVRSSSLAAKRAGYVVAFRSTKNVTAPAA